METFLAANEGLKRRIQHTFTFQDLSTRELAQIFLRKATGKKWRLREVTEEDPAAVRGGHDRVYFMLADATCRLIGEPEDIATPML